MKDLSEDNKEYWQKRAAGYSEVNKEELSGIQHNTWSKFLISQIDECFLDRPRDTITLLDVGAGPGFLSIILAEAGYNVSSIDFSESMIEEAKSNAGPMAAVIDYFKGDAMALPFENESFDVVISRNLTWNLPDPKKAYKSWISVLKTGGIMLVFDANWYAYLVDDAKRMEYEIDRKNVKSNLMEDYNIGEDFDRMEQIALSMPLTTKDRPKWDEEFLGGLHLGQVDSISDIGSRLYSNKEKINYSSTPLFVVRFVKGYN